MVLIYLLLLLNESEALSGERVVDGTLSCFGGIGRPMHLKWRPKGSTPKQWLFHVRGPLTTDIVVYDSDARVPASVATQMAALRPAQPVRVTRRAHVEHPPFCSFPTAMVGYDVVLKYCARRPMLGRAPSATS